MSFNNSLSTVSVIDDILTGAWKNCITATESNPPIWSGKHDFLKHKSCVGEKIDRNGYYIQNIVHSGWFRYLFPNAYGICGTQHHLPGWPFGLLSLTSLIIQLWLVVSWDWYLHTVVPRWTFVNSRLRQVEAGECRKPRLSGHERDLSNWHTCKSLDWVQFIEQFFLSSGERIVKGPAAITYHQAATLSTILRMSSVRKVTVLEPPWVWRGSWAILLYQVLSSYNNVHGAHAEGHKKNNNMKKSWTFLF